MKGRDGCGNEIELTPGQEIYVRLVRDWAQGFGMLVLPYMGRQGGKSVLLATVAEYDRRGWPEDLEETPQYGPGRLPDPRTHEGGRPR